MKKKWLLPLVGFAVILGVGAYLHGGTKPKYAWLVFGAEGKLRVQVCLDGEAIALEQFVDGKSTGRKDHFKNTSNEASVTIPDPDGMTSYVISRISDHVNKADGRTQLMANVDIKGPVEYRQYCDLEMKEDPKEARQAHFHGPLTAGPVTIAWKIPEKLALVRGDKSTDLPALVGTMDGDGGCWVVIRSHGANNEPAFPKGIHPFVEVEFPAKEKDGPSIRKRYPLNQFC
ncbi:MAG TPA: hypothetical protein VGX70_10025 [Gemmataceae bacterium]|jgi:hypothetical protein|nr:hypothetical protein [Gemmataceae bacterium]